MKKILVKSAHLLLIALLCLALGCSLWQLAARALFPQQLPMIGGYAQLTVLSGSMEPAFSAGDLIIIHRETSYQVGDIVSFWDEGSLTTHRLIGQCDLDVQRGWARVLQSELIVSPGAGGDFLLSAAGAVEE